MIQATLSIWIPTLILNLPLLVGFLLYWNLQ